MLGWLRWPGTQSWNETAGVSDLMGTTAPERGAQEARENPAVNGAARLGFALYGVLYLVLAWLTVQLAIGDHPDKASGKGALHQLAEQPVGGVVLWVACAGFAALVVWDVFRAFSPGTSLQERLSPACRAVVFTVLAVMAAQVGLTGEGDEGTDGWTARVLGLPGGRWIVAGIGVGVVCFGAWSVVKGFNGRWRREIDLEGRSGFSGTVLKLLARLGYVTRGLAYATVGALFVWAAWTHDPHQSAGLDQALSRLRGAAYGPWLLYLVALGFACWGAFQLAKVKYLRTRG